MMKMAKFCTQCVPLVIITCGVLSFWFASNLVNIISPYSQNKIRIKTTHIQTTLPEKITPRMNVLFIMADDMRTQIEPYEGPDYLFPQPGIKTPHLSKLASRSLLLKNCFVQYSLCGPSRTSMMTSRRPDTTHVTDNSLYWRTHTGNFTTLPQYFKDNGYRTIGIGKIFHLGSASNYSDPISWSEYIRAPNTDGKYMKDNTNERYKGVTEEELKSIPLQDIISVTKAKEYLEKFAGQQTQNDQPFFLALGFMKPHAAQVCPQKYFDLYSIDTKNRYLTPEEDSQTGPSDYKFKEYRRAYFACISYIDALLGELLDTLHDTDLHNHTIISFVSDHGYHYGEHGWMGKSRNYDMTTRVPMMIHVPGRTDPGILTSSIVEAVDIFPTVVEAAGLPPVQSCSKHSLSVDLCTQGVSFLSLIDKPNQEIKGAAFSQRRGNSDGSRMHYSVRTPRYRFSQWAKLITHNNKSEMVIDPDFEKDMELFDHDIDHKEYKNYAHDPNYENITVSLHTKLTLYASNYDQIFP